MTMTMTDHDSRRDDGTHLQSLEGAILEWKEYMNAEDEFVLGQACIRTLREPATFVISHLALNGLTGGITRDVEQSEGVTLDFARAVWFPAYTFEIGPVVEGRLSSLKMCPLRARTSISDTSQDAWAMLATFGGQTEKISTSNHALPSSPGGPPAPFPIVYTESAAKLQLYRSVYADRLGVALQRPKRSPAEQVAIQQRQAPAKAPSSRSTTTTSTAQARSKQQTRKAETNQPPPLVVRVDHVEFTGLRTTRKDDAWVNTYRSKDNKWVRLTDDDTILGHHILSTHWFEITTRVQGYRLVASLGHPKSVATDQQQQQPPPPLDLARARLGSCDDVGSSPRASSRSRPTSANSARTMVDLPVNVNKASLGRNILQTLSDESSDSEHGSGSGSGSPAPAAA